MIFLEKKNKYAAVAVKRYHISRSVNIDQEHQRGPCTQSDYSLVCWQFVDFIAKNFVLKKYLNEKIFSSNETKRERGSSSAVV